MAPHHPLPNTNGLTSPVFAALGEAFREKSIESSAPTPPESVGNSLSPANVQDLLVQDTIQHKPSPPAHPHRFSGNEDVRGGFSTHSPSNSPRPVHKIPTRRTSGYQALTDPLAVSPRGRPVSLPPHLYQLSSPSGFNLNQIRGISDDLAMGPSRSTSRKTTMYDFYSLDSLSFADDLATSAAENVLLTGSGNSLHIFKIDGENITQIGQLDRLRGSIISAKIIPSCSRFDPMRPCRPLIVLILHGLFNPESGSSRPGSSGSDHSQFDPSYSLGDQARAVPTWQTTVEVYSLREQKKVATLYASELLDVEATGAYNQQVYEPPKPIGLLSIHVNGRFVVVSSMESGEIYIFQTAVNGSEQLFHYIGKTWTSTSNNKGRTWSSSSASSDVERSRDKSPNRSLKQKPPLLSLSHRWLAYVPPVAPFGSTIFGRIMIPTPVKDPPGHRSHTAFSQPQVTCHLETPLEESKINRVARGVTQDFIKGAKWVGDQGMQAFMNYWNKSPETTSPYEQNMQLPPAPQFPPTHASDDPNRQNQQPTLVSILDLEELAKSQGTKPEIALRPIASFALDGGCSFLSFSPSGLNLLTASTKGDVQYVWDLMQAVHLRTTVTTTPSTKSNISQPLVRQIARYTRVTVANIMDVVWREPSGDKFAVITDRGTVHLHDLQPSTRQWPPPPMIRRSHESDKRKSESIISPPSSSGWNSAFSTKPLFGAVRANPLMSFGNLSFAQASAGASAKGSKMMAAGFSKSVEGVTGTVKTLRSWGETRLHVPGSSDMLAPGSVRWWRGDKDAAVVVGKDLIQIHRIVLQNEGKGKKYSAFRGRISDDLKIPSPVDNSKDSSYGGGSSSREFWPEQVPQRRSNHSYINSNPLSHAEIDSSSPYQPFHADSRVNLFNYSDNSYGVGGAWVFGEDINTTLVVSGVGGDIQPAQESDGDFWSEETRREAEEVFAPEYYEDDIEYTNDEQ